MAPGILFDEPPVQAEAISVKQAPPCHRYTQLSAALPQDSLIWHGSKFMESNSYTYVLTAPEVKEIDTALLQFKNLELDGNEINRMNFCLPTLEAKLRDAASEIHTGKGFLVISGFEPCKYSVEDNALIFLGISSYIGEQRGKQDDDGNMFVHLRHDKNSFTVPGQGPTRHTNKASPFHTDFFVDILAFHIRGLAASGGAFKVASTGYIYNKLCTSRPDIIELLAKSDWKFESRGKLFPAQTRPLFFFHDGHPILDFSRRPLLGKVVGATDEPLSGLSPMQMAALNEIESLACENQLCLQLKPGDLVYVNNHALLHSRESFEDSDDKIRHVVRMWLRNPAMAWSLPPQLAEGNRRIFEDVDLPEKWAMEDMPRLPVPWYNFTGASH